MKNYWQSNKAKTKNTLNIHISLLIVAVMVFQLFFPALVFANAEATSTDESAIETGDAVSGTNVESEINTTVIDTKNDEVTVEEDETNEETYIESDTETASTTEEEVEDETTEKDETANSKDENFEPNNTGSTTATSSVATTSPTITEDIEENDEESEFTGATSMTSVQTASSTDDLDPEDSNGTTSTTSDITIDNTATSTTNATGTAETGSNTSTSESGSFSIDTGDAISYVDLVNVVNTNIVNSTGLIDFVREVLGYEDFDLRNMFSDIFEAYLTAETTSTCAENICDPSLLINLANEAMINNNISVIANTGGNTATGGNGGIVTGDAYASANIVNLANTNVIDSNYLLLVFDNFADMAGSLVLPNSDFFSSLFASGHGGVTTVNTDNTATVNNNIATGANTGNNQATGTDTLIETGDATATSYTENLVNQNLVNSNSFSMLVRVHGDWSGDVFGLPEGMQWEETSDGIRLFYENTALSQGTGANVDVTNDATINNNVQVFALTGDNQIEAENNAVIETGNAYADTTTYNIANTNVVGSNWINLIFNIYGNWSGNIAFGQPDLWVGLESQTREGRLSAGDGLTYTYTVFNGGDTTAYDVVLESEFPDRAFETIDRGNGGDREGYSRWSLGDLLPGETRELIITPKISRDFGRHDKLPLPLIAKVSSEQPDGNIIDNEDSILLYVGKKRSNKESFKKTFPASFEIEKFADKDQAGGGETINYTVEMTNKGGQLFDSLLVDTMVNETGDVISEQSWPLETIKNDETITITYSIMLPEGMESGVYTNTAQVVGTHGSHKSKNRTPFLSEIATHELTVGEVPEGEVLGISTDTLATCDPYLTTYLGQGKSNDAVEVVKLQKFLKVHSQSRIIISGVFDNSTKQAVKSFQESHAEEILTPWGLTAGSGYVYYTTKKKINEIMCGGATNFPLTSEQVNEIENYRSGQDGADTTDPGLIGFNTNPLAVPIPEEADSVIAATTTSQRPILSFTPKSIQEPKYSFMNDWIELLKNPLTALR